METLGTEGLFQRQEQVGIKMERQMGRVQIYYLDPKKFHFPLF
jgi:hypothetical protein